METIVYTTPQVAELLQVSVATLKRWRRDSIGPAYLKPEGAQIVLYTKEGIDQWIEKERVATKNQGLLPALAPAMEQFSRGLDADTVEDYRRASALMQTTVTMMWEALRGVDHELPPFWEVVNLDTSEATSAYENYPDNTTIYDL